jgi:hypothetical protein
MKLAISDTSLVILIFGGVGLFLLVLGAASEDGRRVLSRRFGVRGEGLSKVARRLVVWVFKVCAAFWLYHAVDKQQFDWLSVAFMVVVVWWLGAPVVRFVVRYIAGLTPRSRAICGSLIAFAVLASAGSALVAILAIAAFWIIWLLNQIRLELRQQREQQAREQNQ